ncbi:MAG: glycosyltransferase family 2 protein, partial [Candidatus Aenigmarchaeota archaeon]|nr:glycosyltransferase family 2 protein [Candidatus Aenigmarchaeota archaeon]
MVSQEKPLVSVIMSSYNAGRYIAQAIKGILNQTYSNIELIIVDANSSDNTAEIIKRFARIDRRVKPIFLNRRITIAKARNIAIKNAKGQFYATADA